MRSGFSFQVDNFENTLEKAKNKSFKRCFGLIRECEKRIRKKRFQGVDIDAKTDQPFRVSIDGISGSGVKSMFCRYFGNKFIGDSSSVIYVDDSFTREIYIGDKLVKFEFTNGRAFDRSIKDVYIKRASAHLIICSVDSPVHEISLISNMINTVGRVHDDELIPIIICLNKIDVIEGHPERYRLKPDDLREMTDRCSYTNVEIIPTSSKDNINISTVMEKIAKKAYFYIDGYDCMRMRKQLGEVIKKDKKVLYQFDKKPNCILS